MLTLDAHALALVSGHRRKMVLCSDTGNLVLGHSARARILVCVLETKRCVHIGAQRELWHSAGHQV